MPKVLSNVYRSQNVHCHFGLQAFDVNGEADIPDDQLDYWMSKPGITLVGATEAPDEAVTGEQKPDETTDVDAGDPDDVTADKVVGDDAGDPAEAVTGEQKSDPKSLPQNVNLHDWTCKNLRKKAEEDGIVLKGETKEELIQSWTQQIAEFNAGL